MSAATKQTATTAKRADNGEAPVRKLAAAEAQAPQELRINEIVPKGTASDAHEIIVMNFGTILNLIFGENPDMTVRGSNRQVFIPEFSACYAPDLHVVNGPVATQKIRPGFSANLNPWLVMEVLSGETAQQDLAEKLPRYKKIASLKHIVFMQESHVFASVYHRVEESNVWQNIDCHTLEEAINIGGAEIGLQDIYMKVQLG